MPTKREMLVDVLDAVTSVSLQLETLNERITKMEINQENVVRELGELKAAISAALAKYTADTDKLKADLAAALAAAGVAAVDAQAIVDSTAAALDAAAKPLEAFSAPPAA